MAEFLSRHRASVWLAFTIAILASTMMHPSLASLITISLIGVLLAVLRKVAQLEGRVSQ